ncbi:MAG TPA: DUF11 domain-containing protein [Gemmatimonadales bacterium]|nr:DUF11 domain-containing protein [Gemmatimonadales bacterium]
MIRTRPAGLAIVVALALACTDDPTAPPDTPPAIPVDTLRANLVSLPACTKRWAAGVSGDWSVGANWSPAGVPGAAAVVCIDAAGTYTVTTATARQMNALVVGGPNTTATLAYTGTTSGAAWNITTGVHVKVGSILRWDNPVTLTTGFIQVDGTLRPNAPTGTTVVVVDSLRNNGTFDVNRSALLLYVAAFHNNGTLQATGTAATLTIYGSSSGVIAMEGGTMAGQGSIVATTTLPSLFPPPTSLAPALFTWTGGSIPARLAGGGARFRVLGIPISFEATTLQGQLELETVALSLSGFVWATPVITTDDHLPAGVQLDITGNGQAILPPGNRGVITVSPVDSLTLWFDDVLLNPAPGAFTNLGSFIINPGTDPVRMETDSIENGGTLTLSGPATIPPLHAIHNLGTIASTNTIPLDLGTANFVAEPGSTQTGLLYLEGGVLSGTGSVGSVTSVGGTIAPGPPATAPALPGLGTLTLASLFLDPASTITIDLAGTAPSKHDLLAVTGLVVYNGTLRVAMGSSYFGGHCGEVIPVITDGANGLFRGAFASVTGLTPTATRGWRVYNPTASLQLVGHDPSVPVSVSPAAVTVTEGGAGSSYNLCLRTAPTATVTVTPSDVTGQVTAVPVAFTTTAWALPGAASVSAVNDALVEPPPQLATITHVVASTDPAYAGTVPAPVTATIVDNDGVTNLELHVFSTPPVVTVGSSFTLTLQNENLGPNTSVGATFTIPASAGFTYASSTGTLGCSYDAVTGTTCQLPSLASGGKTDFTVTLTALVAGAYSTSYTISTIQGDSNLLNNTRTQTITVQ